MKAKDEEADSSKKKSDQGLQREPRRAPVPTQTLEIPRRQRHRRLSNIRRLLRALGLISSLIGVVFSQAQAPRSANRQQFLRILVAAAIERTRHEVTYDPGYVVIAYPGGDVPANSGVCSDEIVRAYRAVGIDLQKEVHEDIALDPLAYPLMSRWKQKLPDSNIDHRRVANLMVFFTRKGEPLLVTSRAADYRPGDLVAWDLGNGRAIHIGMVVDQQARSGRYMIVHNIGAGPKMEDVLFDWKIIGHYRYFGPAT